MNIVCSKVKISAYWASIWEWRHFY